MRFFDFKPSSSSPRLARRLAVCALLPAFLHDVSAAIRSDSARQNRSNPYLLVSLPPPLRFAEPVEVAEPIAAAAAPHVIGPPHPGEAKAETPAVPAAPEPVSDVLAAPVEPVPEPPSVVVETTPAAAQSAPAQDGVMILPDDTPQAIRPEDLLLYFQFPAAAPPSGSLPRSSATFQQQ